MNQQQLILWSAMAERQRDALVARHVFGYTPLPDGGNWWEASLWETPWGNVVMRDSSDGIPPFSTSLDAIWPGVEQIRAKMMRSRLQDNVAVARYQKLTRALSSTPFYALNSQQAARTLCELLLDLYDIEVTP